MPIVKVPNHSVHVHTVLISSTVPPVSLSSNRATHTYALLQLICASCAVVAHHLEIRLEFSSGAGGP